MFGIPDSYTIRARIFPALLAALPGLALAAVMVSWRQLGVSHVIATGAAMVLLHAFSDLARRQGKRLEGALFRKMGGKPSTSMLRHRDTRFDAATKASWLEFLAGRIKEKAPPADAEAADPAVADAFYERCGDWLREHTRDQKRFKLIFEELVTYGFRRNLLGLKWPGLALNGLVDLASIIVLWFRLPFSADDVVSTRLVYVLAVAACHALYFALAVNEKVAIEAADQYGRQLLLGCETLMGATPAAQAGKRSRSKPTEKEATAAAS
jgi:hypothetical protein